MKKKSWAELEREEVIELSKKGQPVRVVRGAFGEIDRCEGIVKEVLTPPEGGLYTKFYGCKYLFKGYPDKTILDMLGLPKAMIGRVPIGLLKNSFWVKAFLLFMFLFRRQELIHYARVYFSAMYSHGLKSMNISWHRFNNFTKELKRAVESAIRYESLYETSSLINAEELDYKGEREIWGLIAYISELFYFVIEFDNAYRFRFQDIVAELNKENMIHNPIKEIKRLFDILIERENSQELKTKWKLAKYLTVTLIRFNTTARKFVQRLSSTLDINKIKMDEHDRYFMFNRNSYNHEGKTLTQRMKEKVKIDKRDGNIYISMDEIREIAQKEKEKLNKLQQDEEKRRTDSTMDENINRIIGKPLSSI